MRCVIKRYVPRLIEYLSRYGLFFGRFRCYSRLIRDVAEQLQSPLIPNGLVVRIRVSPTRGRASILCGGRSISFSYCSH